MSTGADCIIRQKGTKWFYDLQDYPYGSTPDYQTFGPFKSFAEATDHLDKHHANPGGFSIQHDPAHPCEHEKKWQEEGHNGSIGCRWCGDQIKAPKIRGLLRCSNPDCESRVGEQACQEPFFNVNTTVYANRSVAEPMSKRDVADFECGMCGAAAEEDPQED